MKDIIIFGAGSMADVVQYYMRHESALNVVAFTVDREFAVEPSFRGLPLVPFEELREAYPPETHAIFVALGYQDLNAARASRVKAAKELGYEVISFVHPKAEVPECTRYGENCLILNNVCLQPHVEMGDNVWLWGDAIVGHHSVIGNNCWITAGANISGLVKLGDNCFLAINCTIGNEVEIGGRCFLGANTLVTKHLKEKSVIIEPSTPVYRLDSDDFLRITNFR